MVIALAIAMVIPFELFLFAYAVLGPLHYFTEINWLNEKSFFVPDKKYIWVLVGLTALASLPLLTRVAGPWLANPAWWSGFTLIQQRAYGSIVMMCLVIAAGLVLGQRFI